jgi:TolB-like protein/DNA-binding winged helix-turn-helix (wHTH) protein/tetratricopeptide (TPR) repeat protein
MGFDETQNETIRFGAFELKLRSGELYREGTVVKLPPQPYKVLLLLIRNAGQLITRNELQEKIWGTDVYVDFDKGLNLCIAQIREALGDDAQSPRYIETLQRRGYRFIANIDQDAFPLHEQPDEAEFPEQVSMAMTPRLNEKVRGSFLRPTLVFSLMALIFIVTATAFYFRSHSSSPNSNTTETKSMLLVLPFENLTNDPAQDYFSDGLTEEMITRLGSLQPKRLGVIARTTALTYKKTTKDIRQIGDDLGVNYVLEGSVRREAGRLRITSQLIQVNDQTHLWAETFDRDETDVLDIQREVVIRIASSLSLELLPSSHSEVAADREAKPEAYDAYLKGRYLITKDTPEDLERSIPYFDQAIAEDPDFAPAYAAQVEALVLLSDWTGSTSIANLPKAKAAALKAVELNPSYAEAYAALGSVQFWLEWDRSNAEINFKRAVELNPYNPLTRLNFGRCLLAKGETDAAVNEINEALKLDPVSLLTTGLAAFAQLQAGRYDEAIALSNRMLELEPKSWAARECLFQAYVNKGNYPQALNIDRERMIMSGAKPKDLQLLGIGSPKDVLETRFRKNLHQMQESVGNSEKVSIMYAAWLAMTLAKNDEALLWLEKGISERSPFIMYLGINPIWNPLRSDSRFVDLSKRTAF